MNVLSLFDGISCGRVALERAKIKVDRYYASEIDKNAIKITQHNYPDTIQLGDIRKIDGKQLPNIDLFWGVAMPKFFHCRENEWCKHKEPN